MTVLGGELFALDGRVAGDASGGPCGPGALVAVSFSGGVHIDSESESEDTLSSVSVETVGTEEDKRGSFAFTSSLGFVTISMGIDGTGGGLCGASIGGGGGAKGGSFNWAGTFRTCRNIADAYAGQIAKNKHCTTT